MYMQENKFEKKFDITILMKIHYPLPQTSTVELNSKKTKQVIKFYLLSVKGSEFALGSKGLAKGQMSDAYQL